ncbi:hypothetical protein EI555_016707 [Monodon monoceros]|uniref:Chemokine interleukin-8-like domain-containing protein n=1 Tax=Monodon monoceros TaxID=40151 RepID=A0A4V5P9R0_MONMO|nr:hypothetical protein EI555_016707 [Monodon monoceros]
MPLAPSTTSCCTPFYRQPLSSKLLRNIIQVEFQEADGNCHLQAFVFIWPLPLTPGPYPHLQATTMALDLPFARFHLSRRSVCIHPQNRSLTL